MSVGNPAEAEQCGGGEPCRDRAVRSRDVTPGCMTTEQVQENG